MTKVTARGVRKAILEGLDSADVVVIGQTWVAKGRRKVRHRVATLPQPGQQVLFVLPPHAPQVRLERFRQRL